MTSLLTASKPDTESGRRQCLIELCDVSVYYPDSTAPAVSGVNLNVHEGECLLILGPSGCGKSTLALAMANLIPSGVEGEVTGHIVTNSSLSRPGGIGYVFQDPETQFCMLQVDDEVAFGLENARIPRRAMSERIQHALSQVDLVVEDYARHESFSGGMKQKLAIATAIALDAPLLILDEPTANLDPLSTRLVCDTIGRLRQQGRTMIVIEHKFDLVLPHVDRVVLFNEDGTIYRVGPTESVLLESWDWLVSVGIVPPWKGVPDWLKQSERPVTGLPSRVGSDRLPVLGGAQTPAIEVRHATLTYGSASVWRDVTCTIPAGSFTAVVGPNGAGKSSLLQVMAGLQRVPDGEVTVLSRPVQDWKRHPLSSTISYCFQNPEFQFIFERVGDELANRVVGDTVPEDVQRLLAEFGLAKYASQSPYALSQGQKRRLSVASMLREAHDIYILDEPTFGQDAGTQQVIMDRLQSLHRAGKTVVVATHDMELVHTYATHVLVLADGTLTFSGAPETLFQREDILRQAHLLDDVASEMGPLQHQSALRERSDRSRPERHTRGTFAARLDPGLHLVTAVVATLLAMFANTLSQAVSIFLLPVALLLFASNLGPVAIAKRYAPFIAFYALYIWSFVAYSAVPVGTPTIHFLWWRLSLFGLHNGLVLAFRMLGAVGFGILLVSTSDITDMIVSLTKNFRIKPKIAYGVLAGIRFMPLFRSEWRKLKQARWLRGKDARWRVLRPVTFSLPLLSQAVRMSERVAVAMEARGFIHEAADHAGGRTFYRTVSVHAIDVVYGVSVVLVLIGILVLA